MARTNRKKVRADRYHHGDLRAALVAQARRIVERKGPAQVSLRGIAKAAGVSQAAPYHHFKDKHALLAAVAADGFREFTRTMIERAAGASDPEDRLHKLGLGYVEFAVQHPALYWLMQGPTFRREKSDSELAEARRESAAPLVDAVTACIPGASAAQIKNACAAAWSIVHGMATLCNDGRMQTMIDGSDLEATARTIIGQLDIRRALDVQG